MLLVFRIIPRIYKKNQILLFIILANPLLPARKLVTGGEFSG